MIIGTSPTWIFRLSFKLSWVQAVMAVQTSSYTRCSGPGFCSDRRLFLFIVTILLFPQDLIDTRKNYPPCSCPGFCARIGRLPASSCSES